MKMCQHALAMPHQLVGDALLAPIVVGCHSLGARGEDPLGGQLLFPSPLWAAAEVGGGPRAVAEPPASGDFPSRGGGGESGWGSGESGGATVGDEADADELFYDAPDWPMPAALQTVEECALLVQSLRREVAVLTNKLAAAATAAAVGTESVDTVGDVVGNRDTDLAGIPNGLDTTDANDLIRDVTGGSGACHADP